MAHTGVDAEPVHLIEALLVGDPGGELYLDLRSSLEPHLAALLTRHKDAAAKADWSCHQFLPLEAFRAHPRRHRPLSRAAYTAVETALLTEVNLPWYTAGLSHGFRRCPAPIQEFVRVWTSEEDQHATLLETYLLLSGNGDPAARARARKAVITAGWTHQLGSPFEGMVYTAIQEAVTRTFYLCTARACEPEDPGLAEALRRIAKDETLHMAFYRDVVKVHLDLDAGYVQPLATVLCRFQMPWSASFAGDFVERQAYVEAHGGFTLADYYRDVVQFLWSYWGIDRLAPRGEDARRALVQLRKYRSVLCKFAGCGDGLDARPESEGAAGTKPPSRVTAAP
jgi:acyl-[acyl-carrier-protein] desaturase